MTETAPEILEVNAAESSAETSELVAKTFIETQFPVSLLSKECYKERKAGAGQTLTALGSYWKGRKPLILVRACILGCLLPATGDPKGDRELFLQIMLMDEAGLKKRWQKSIPAKVVLERLGTAVCGDDIVGSKWRSGVSLEIRKALQARAFKRMSYDEKLEYCLRPEEMAEDAWKDVWPTVNRRLKTSVSSLPELIEELGKRCFGHRPRVADTFCGGGSIPFEAARMGCDVHASDLNPIAAMLTWGALNVIGAKDDVTERLAKVQKSVAAKVRRTIDDLGVEEGTAGWRGKVYLYCLEVKCPRTGWLIPLAPSWVISETHSVIAELVPDEKHKRFEIEIISGVSKTRLEQARQGTVRDGLVCHPLFPKEQTPLRTIRGDGQPNANCWGNSLRLWTKSDVVPHADDIYQERLYCIQWTRTRYDQELGRDVTETEFRSVEKGDLRRERLVLEEVSRNLSEWQNAGLIPDSTIESGDKTDEPMRTRGWTHWHHLFHPRQLLTLALYKWEIDRIEDTVLQGAMGLVFCRVIDWCSRLSHWDSSRDQASHTFYNQAFNTFNNYSVRGIAYLENLSMTSMPSEMVWSSAHEVAVCTAGLHRTGDDFFITDPPYGDAVNYHEITEFFIAWMRRRPPTKFAQWTWDSRRALAVRGNGIDFTKSMVETYSALTEHMSPNGMQVVMFTHNDPSVWAGVTLILWAAGLQVTGVWNVRTETSSDLKQGNFVQGTALMILRRRTGDDNAWSHKMKKRIRGAVENTIEFMMRIEKGEEPNFCDADYLHSAYAAALEVLTQHKTLDNQDIASEIFRDDSQIRKTIESLLEDARRFASEFLVPRKLDLVERVAAAGGLSGKEIWADCAPEERFFLKGVELENAGELRVGAFQETARGFGIDEYKFHMPAVQANNARLKTAKEWKGSHILDRGDSVSNTDDFGSSVVRHALYGIYLAMEKQDLRAAITWFEKFMPEYWDRRKRLLGILEFLATASAPWRQEEARWARDLAGAVLNHGS